MPDQATESVLQNLDEAVIDDNAYSDQDNSGLSVYVDDDPMPLDEDVNGDDVDPEDVKKDGEKQNGKQIETKEVSEDAPQKTEVEKLKADLQAAQELVAKANHEKNTAFAKLRTLEKEEKGKQSGDELTDEQLQAIINEHGDDKQTLFRVMKYMAERQGKSAQDKAVSAIEISQRKRELDDYAVKNFPALFDENSHIHSTAPKIKSDFGIEDNPYSDFITGSIIRSMHYEEGLKEAFNKGLEIGRSGDANQKRKQDLKEKKLSGSSPKGSSKGVQSENDETKMVREALNMTKSQYKTYLKLRGEENA